MVRLVGFPPLGTAKSNFSFQFQYGAIGSLNVGTGPGNVYGFNSSMVRLVEITHDKRHDTIHCFNSSMVRLVEMGLW